MKTITFKDDSPAAELGRFLKRRREHRDFSQQQVATGVGKSSAQTVSNWERGVAVPSVDVLAALGSLLAIPRREMLRAIMRYQKRLSESCRAEAVRLLSPSTYDERARRPRYSRSYSDRQNIRAANSLASVDANDRLTTR